MKTSLIRSNRRNKIMTITLYYLILFQVDSLFPPDATDSDSAQTESDENPLQWLLEGPSPAPDSSEFDQSENKEQDLFGLECPERGMFMTPSNAVAECPLITESDGVWFWETPHPYSSLTCCLETFTCPNSSHQIHIQIKSYFGIKTSSNPNQCEVKGVQSYKNNYTLTFDRM